MINFHTITAPPLLALSAHLVYVYGVGAAPVAFFPFALGCFALFDLAEQRQKNRDKR